jgi:hypothetical protein
MNIVVGGSPGIESAVMVYKRPHIVSKSFEPMEKAAEKNAVLDACLETKLPKVFHI